jgi:hypothetical protein
MPLSNRPPSPKAAWEDLLAARQRLHAAFDLFQYRAMHQQQLIRFGGAQDALGPLPESALDAFLDLRKQLHG